ncbi:hypothetical protein GE061_015564 [Apolygus lucorum]|uniref:Uncharacterized protein n=1 Tax=Apolygus lucorum TaxID=248454 RepID=A0A8S9XLI1_APOLU|nr:hypothetical protein GE061_015564 [Apolygus lucorum]
MVVTEVTPGTSQLISEPRVFTTKLDSEVSEFSAGFISSSVQRDFLLKQLTNQSKFSKLVTELQSNKTRSISEVISLGLVRSSTKLEFSGLKIPVPKLTDEDRPEFISATTAYITMLTDSINSALEVNQQRIDLDRTSNRISNFVIKHKSSLKQQITSFRTYFTALVLEEYERKRTQQFIELIVTNDITYDPLSTGSFLHASASAKATHTDTLIPPTTLNTSLQVKYNLSLHQLRWKELKKISSSKRSGASADEVYTPASWVFSALSFLERFEKPVERPVEPLVDQELQERDGTQTEDTEMLSQDSQSANAHQTSANSTASTSSMHPPPSPLLTRKKKIKTQGPISKQNQLLQKACALLETPSKPDSNIPSIAIAWGEKLLTLESRQRAFAEKAINDILFEATMGTLNRDSVKINLERDPLTISDNSHQHSSSSLTSYNYSDYTPSMPNPSQQTTLYTQDQSLSALFQSFKE